MPLCRVDPREWGRDAGLTLHEAAGPSCARPLCAFCWACGDAGSWLDLHLPGETTLDLRHLLRRQSRLQALFPFPSGRSCGSFFCTHSHTYMRKRGEPRRGHCRPTGPREPGVASSPRPERSRCGDRVRGRACPARRWHRLCPDPDFEIVADSRAVCRRRRPESAAHRAVAPGWHRDSARPLRGLDVGRHSRGAGVPVCTGPPVLSRPRGLPPLETARLCSVAVTLSL